MGKWVKIPMAGAAACCVAMDVAAGEMQTAGQIVAQNKQETDGNFKTVWRRIGGQNSHTSDVPCGQQPERDRNSPTSLFQKVYTPI